MNIVKASNESKGILITCPHCKLGSRYDSSYVEDAIKINHNIICVACGGEFNLILSPIEEAVEQNAHLTGGGLCAKCGSPSWVHGAIGHDFIAPHPQVTQTVRKTK